MPLIRRQDDHITSWMAASLVGSAATLVTGPAIVATDLITFAQMLFFAPFAIIWIVPFWLIGVGAIGVPVWIGLERVHRDGIFASLALGAVSAGLVWAAGAYALSPAGHGTVNLPVIMKAFLGGAFAGGIAGLAGWRFSRRMAPEPQQ